MTVFPLMFNYTQNAGRIIYSFSYKTPRAERIKQTITTRIIKKMMLHPHPELELLASSTGFGKSHRLILLPKGFGCIKLIR